MRFGVAGFQSDRLPILVDRLVGLSFPGQREAEVEMGFRVAGVQLQGLLKLADGLVELLLLGQCDAEVVVGFGTVGFGRVAFPGQRCVQVLARGGVIGLQSQRFMILLDGLVPVPAYVQSNAEVIVGFGVVGFEPEGLLKLARLPRPGALGGPGRLRGYCASRCRRA